MNEKPLKLIEKKALDSTEEKPMSCDLLSFK